MYFHIPDDSELFKYSYKGFRIFWLCMIFVLLGVATFAVYDFYNFKNPVEPTNFSYVEGTLNSFKEWHTDSGSGFNISLSEFPNVIFSPEVGRNFTVSDFKRREKAGNKLRMIVDKKSFEVKRKRKSLFLDRKVDIYEISSEKHVYFRALQAQEYYSDEKKYALAVAITLPIVIFLLLPHVVVNPDAESKVFRKDIFFGYELRNFLGDNYYMFIVHKSQIKAVRIGGPVYSPFRATRNPAAYGKPELIKKYLHEGGQGRYLEDVDKKNFYLSPNAVSTIDINSKKDVLYQMCPQSGTIVLRFRDGALRKFVLLGQQSLDNLFKILTDANFKVFRKDIAKSLDLF